MSRRRKLQKRRVTKVKRLHFRPTRLELVACVLRKREANIGVQVLRSVKIT